MAHYFEIQELKGHYTGFIRFCLSLNNYELQSCEWAAEGNLCQANVSLLKEALEGSA